MNLAKVLFFSAIIYATVATTTVAAEPNLSVIYGSISKMTYSDQIALMKNPLGEGTGKVAYLNKDAEGNNYVLKVCKESTGCVELLQQDTLDSNAIKKHFGDLFANFFPTDSDVFQTAFLFPCAANNKEVKCHITLETFVSSKHFDISEDFVPEVGISFGAACLWKSGESEEDFEHRLMTKTDPVIAQNYGDVLSIKNGQSFATMSTLLKTWDHIFEDIQGGFLGGNNGFVGYDTGAVENFTTDKTDKKNCQINWICAVSQSLADFEDVPSPC